MGAAGTANGGERERCVGERKESKRLTTFTV
jgi:hypothetical protein